ncbi:MAG: alpha-amylase family glycosyl hydrolase, partial [Propionicimonas sp.]|nr:alpha-amylase family glycosyl hydrolase [Propionicimonas sp.]
QPDLNWENPALRAEVHRVMNWWVDRGVDGFRMDVINYISKAPELGPGAVLPNGFEDGAAHFSFGARLREYLDEARTAVFAGRDGDYLTVGETPGATPAQALDLVGGSAPVIDMLFQFEHMDLDQRGATKWDLQPVSAPDLARSLAGWQLALGTDGWNSLYLANHDQPRPVSRFGDPEHHRYSSATALATMLHLMRGTPYVFQGEELGVLNPELRSADDLRDVESINFHREAVAAGRSPEEVLQVLRRKARDNARSPMPWTGEPNAGFSANRSWAPIAESSSSVNVADQVHRDDSVFAYYRRLIALRKQSDVVVFGDFALVGTGADEVFAYMRTLDDEALLVIVNLCSQEREYLIPPATGVLLLTNSRADVDPCLCTSGTLAPWEARVYRVGVI